MFISYLHVVMSVATKLIVSLLILQFLSCNTSNESIKDISVFKEFIGLKHGDTIDKVYDIYGPPDTILKSGPEREFHEIVYRKNAKTIIRLQYFRETSIIRTIKVKFHPATEMGSDTYFERRNIKDEKLNLLGMNIKDILTMYGSGYDHLFNDYEYVSFSDKLIVRFTTMKDANRCKSIIVTWHK